MPIVKPTARMLNQQLNRLSELKSYLRRLEVLGTGKDTEFWKALKSHLEIVRDGAQLEIMNRLGSSNGTTEDLSECKRLAGQKLTADDLLNQVERNADVTDLVRSQIANLEKQVDELKAQQTEGVFA